MQLHRRSLSTATEYIRTRSRDFPFSIFTQRFGWNHFKEKTNLFGHLWSFKLTKEISAASVATSKRKPVPPKSQWKEQTKQRRKKAEMEELLPHAAMYLMAAQSTAGSVLPLFTSLSAKVHYHDPIGRHRVCYCLKLTSELRSELFTALWWMYCLTTMPT